MRDVTPDQQAMWDALGILGFDLDGNSTPAALVATDQSFRDEFLRNVRQARADHDEAIDEVCLDPTRHLTSMSCWCSTCHDRQPWSAVTGFPRFRGMIVCPDCGNKRCPKATLHEHACTGSNEPGQLGSAYA